MLDNAATRFCKPEVVFTSKEWNIKGKKVLEVIISKSDTIPHRTPDHNEKMKAYIRVKDQNILANGIQMKIWHRDNSNKEIKFIYSEDVRKVLGLFNKFETLTIKQLLAEVNLSRFKLESMLCELIRINIINMTVGETSASFHLNETPEK